jgi:hypothetical protein
VVAPKAERPWGGFLVHYLPLPTTKSVSRLEPRGSRHLALGSVDHGSVSDVFVCHRGSAFFIAIKITPALPLRVARHEGPPEARQRGRQTVLWIGPEDTAPSSLSRAAWASADGMGVGSPHVPGAGAGGSAGGL